jgi:thiol-disulfide isomerase/thioredoxin
MVLTRMKSKGIFIIVLVVLVLLTGAFFLTQNKGEPVKEIQNTSPQADGQVVTSDKYIYFSSGDLGDNSRRRVLFFYANWCPTCRPVDQELSQNIESIPDDLQIIRVNYDDSDTDSEEESLANKYGVTYQHTFVQIDEDGQEISKWNGGGLSQILSNIK